MSSPFLPVFFSASLKRQYNFSNFKTHAQRVFPFLCVFIVCPLGILVLVNEPKGRNHGEIFYFIFFLSLQKRKTLIAVAVAFNDI